MFRLIPVWIVVFPFFNKMTRKYLTFFQQVKDILCIIPQFIV